MTLPYDILTNLAANLASDLLTGGASALRDYAFGDAETRALRHAWEAAFRALLESAVDEAGADVLETIFRNFVQAEGVAAALLDLALAGGPPPLDLLRARFDALDYDRATLPVDFNTALCALTEGLSAALLAEAQTPDSPLYNRVSLVRTAAIHALLRQQHADVRQIAATVARLEAQLPTAKYNLVFLGPASGFAVGDRAQAQPFAPPPALPPELTPLLGQALELLTSLARERQPAPYTPADRDAYLQAVEDECKDIHLFYDTEKGATLPLERIYVALKADLSSSAERKASQELMKQLVEEQRAGDALPPEKALARVMILDPYAARYLIYDPKMQAELRAAAREAQERTYHLAEIVRRYRWMVLLGDPGSGKSTLARWLALHLARALLAGEETLRVDGGHVRPDAEPGAAESLGAARLPVLVRIAEYAAARWPKPGHDTELRLLAYVGQRGGQDSERATAFRALLRDYLEAGRVTFILDGLDEVTEYDQRAAIAAEIEGLIGAWVRDAAGRCPLDADYYPTLMAEPAGWQGNQALVTSRIVGYQFCPLHAALPHFVIQPMEDAAVRRFCENWGACYGAPEQGAALAAAVLKHPNPNVREQMGRNPLLLTILAQVFQENPAAGLPARRTELYREAETAVFRQRGAEWARLAGQLGTRDLVAALRRITARVAFNLHANPDFPAALVDAGSVRQWLRTAVRDEPALSSGRREDDVVRELLAAAGRLSGFFVARGENAYGFLHRQFQEYFAGRYLATLLQAGETLTPYLSRLEDPAWREVLLLTLGILEREAPRLTEKVMHSVLDASDPTGGLLPYTLLLAADALQELARPPEALVRRVAAGLITAYSRADEARFAALAKRVRATFAALPRQAQGRDPVGAALCAALVPSPPGGEDQGEGERFTRMAAAELIEACQWFTPATARALTQSWQAYTEPAGTLLSALQAHYDAHPEHFAALDLPFRQAMLREPALWAQVQAHAHWQAVAQALYPAPWATPAPEAAVRDSPLTPELIARLRQAPEDSDALRAWLWQVWEGADDAAARDAGLALVYLGERRLAESLAADGANRPLARAICAASYLALAFAFDLTRDLAHNLDFARDLARNLDLARARDLARDLARALALDLARDLALDRARARDLDLDLDRALDRARARDRARGLDLARARGRGLDNYLLEIETLLAQALTRARTAPGEEASALVSALESAQRRLAGWRAGLPSGALAFWQALGETLESAAEPFNAWSAAPRPRLNRGRLQALESVRQQGEALPWSTLLPRLDGTPLSDLEGAAAAEAQATLEAWLNLTGDDRPATGAGDRDDTTAGGPAAFGAGLFARHAALLLVEMRCVTPHTVPWLCLCLCDPVDLTRYRAQRALGQERKASALGRETIEQLARCYRCSGQHPGCSAVACWRTVASAILPSPLSILPDTCLDWSLKEITHDEPDWLRAWAAAGATHILGRIHRLDEAAWPTFLDLLAAAAPEVQAALLDSVSWLARLERIPEGHAETVAQTLLALLESAAPAVRAAALEAAGHLRPPAPALIEHFLAQASRIQQPAISNQQPVTNLTFYETLARLAVAVEDEALRARLTGALRAALPDEAAAAGWARFSVATADEKAGATLLAELAEAIPEPSALLAALLRAGTDDDFWDDYHKRIAALAAAWVQEDSEGALLRALLQHLRAALAGEAWPPKRIALAAAAAAAQEMPDALNAALRAQTFDGPEALLLEGTRDAGSHNSRRHAITALSRLHTATPAVAAAVLDAAGDVSIVQQDAIAAAANFRHLSRDFAEEDALAPLEAALTGESAARAYLAAQVLAALGSSPAALQAPGLRQRIAEALSAAIRHPEAGREVYVLSDDDIKGKGPLSQALFAALVKVWGLPE